MMQNVFTKTLERITKETGLVGGVAIVFKNGEITFAAPYGYEDRENNIPMTLNASFDIASCSKAWTVMLAAQAVDEGLIGWDEPVQHANTITICTLCWAILWRCCAVAKAGKAR